SLASALLFTLPLSLGCDPCADASGVWSVVSSPAGASPCSSSIASAPGPYGAAAFERRPPRIVHRFQRRSTLLAFVVFLVVHFREQAMGLLGADLARCETTENITAGVTRRGGLFLITAEAHRLQHIGQARLDGGIRDAEHILDILDCAPAAQKYLDEFELLIVEAGQPPKALIGFAPGGGRAIATSGRLTSEAKGALERAATAITAQA